MKEKEVKFCELFGNCLFIQVTRFTSIPPRNPTPSYPNYWKFDQRTMNFKNQKITGRQTRTPKTTTLISALKTNTKDCHFLPFARHGIVWLSLSTFLINPLTFLSFSPSTQGVVSRCWFSFWWKFIVRHLYGNFLRELAYKLKSASLGVSISLAFHFILGESLILPCHWLTCLIISSYDHRWII